MPFKLEFYSNRSAGKYFDSFSTSLDSVLKDEESYMHTVKEAHDLRILFTVPNLLTGKLQMEFMDVLPENLFKEEEENFFLASEEIRPLYLHANSSYNVTKTEYPYILPGQYIIKVRVQNIEYYALLKVESLRISEEQLIVMREEVEDVVSGLSRKLYNKEMEVNSKDSSIEDINIYYKYDLLIRYSNILLINLNEIINNPYYEIRKKHSLEYKDKNVKTDLETIKFKQRRSDVTHKINGYSYELNYDVKINRELLFILRKIDQEINSITAFSKGVLERLFRERVERKKYKRRTEEIIIEIEKTKKTHKKLQQIRSYLNTLHNSDWVKRVNRSKGLGDTIHLNKRPNYRVFFKLYKELDNKNDINDNRMQHYLYYWKETPVLFEIWGFVKLLDVILSSKYNFNGYKGWIFDEPNYYRVNPFLDEETIIEFKNEDGLRFKVYYDSFIEEEPSATSPENPLFSHSNHNRPDFRLDVYDGSYYKGSLIVDFKYRDKGSLGNYKEFKNNDGKRNYYDKTSGYRVYKQLSDYGNAQTLYLNTIEKNVFSKSTVVSVWALFPLMGDEDNEVFESTETRVRRISLSPGKSTDHIQEELERLVDYII